MLQVVCVTPRPCSHKEKKSLSFIWASGQCPRTGGSLHTPTPAPVGQRARSGLPAACYERLWVSSSDYCLGGFTQSLHLSHPQMRLLFPLSLSCSITLSLFLPPSLFLECFLFLWSQVSDSRCLRCGFIYPEGFSFLAQRRNTKPTVGDALLLITVSLPLFICCTLSLFGDFVIHKTAWFC